MVTRIAVSLTSLPEAQGHIDSSELGQLWKRIGYYEIGTDINELVMQGALLILFPPTSSNDWAL